MSDVNPLKLFSLFAGLACGNATLPLVAVRGVLCVMKWIFWSVNCCQSEFNHQVLLACIWPLTPANCMLCRPSHCLMTLSPFRPFRKILFWICKRKKTSLGLCLSGLLEVASEDIYYRLTLALVQSLISRVQSGLAEQRLNRQIDPLNAFGHWFLLCPWKWQSTFDPRLSITKALQGSSCQSGCIFFFFGRCFYLFCEMIQQSWGLCEQSVINSNGACLPACSQPSWLKVTFRYFLPLSCSNTFSQTHTGDTIAQVTLTQLCCHTMQESSGPGSS